MAASFEGPLFHCESPTNGDEVQCPSSDKESEPEPEVCSDFENELLEALSHEESGDSSDSSSCVKERKRTKNEARGRKRQRKNGLVESNKSKDVVKVADDSFEKNYNARLRCFFEPGPDGQAEEDYFDIGDDFKVPCLIWDKLYPYQQAGVRWLWELHQNSCGGIIGDEMGLGKTIQVITFMAGLSISRIHNFREVGKSTLGPVILVCPATLMGQWLQELHKWWPPFRVFILHHTGSYKGKKGSLIKIAHACSGILITSYSTIVTYQDLLLKYDWHYVILDEGHKIRNPDAQVTLACKRFRTPHRLILSGSPIQNNLRELWSLFDFIYPGKLGTLPVFMEQLAVPITQGGYANASDVQVEIAYKCARILQETIRPYLLRRMKADVKMVLNLPSKNEQVLFCRLTDYQRNMYQEYLTSSAVKDIFNKKLDLFTGLINLRKMSNHPDIFSPLVENQEGENHGFGYYKRSGKMIVMDSLLRLWFKQQHRVLLFTQGKQMMNILEKYVQRKKYSYILMDGSTPVRQRQDLINRFNNSNDIFIFLLTTRVGGLGVNLTGADRVVIYDPDWNPSTDIQARERAWRIGQTKQVTIYRLLTAGTVEEKIYHRQIFKQYLTNRVLKDPRQQRFFKTNHLFELFTLGSDSGKTDTSAIFAGTGSEVKVKKDAKDPLKQLKKSEASSATTKAVVLPPQKVEELRAKAKMLSQMIAQKFGKQASESANCSDSPTSSDLALEESRANTSESSAPTADRDAGAKGATVEGKRIKYLVKTGSYKYANLQPDETELNTKQDDYVLKKLFKKSSMHSALKHDVIEGSTNPDYVIIEKEAEKVAMEAISALKKSRQYCYQASTGIPSWTGANSLFKKGPKASNPSSSSKGPDSKALIAAMSTRNSLSSKPAEAADEYQELLGDIRHFIAFQSKSNGEATTNELLDHFRSKMPARNTPVFKSMLWKLCDFHKTTDGTGVWKIKEEFS